MTLAVSCLIVDSVCERGAIFEPPLYDDPKYGRNRTRKFRISLNGICRQLGEKHPRIPVNLATAYLYSRRFSVADVSTIAALGFRSLICNRPEGEGPDQPIFDEISRAAQTVGLSTRYLPVVTGKVEDATAAEFGKALQQLRGPVLAYCRSGTRAATFWALSEAGCLPIPEILQKA